MERETVDLAGISLVIERLFYSRRGECCNFEDEHFLAHWCRDSEDAQSQSIFTTVRNKSH